MSTTTFAPVSAKPPRYRPDIEGLRAVAIGLVLVFHAGVRFLPGGFVGVDVFFVISGFLITGILVREIERDGKISLTRFYARRAKRLLPAAGLVLAVTSILTWLTVSVVEWRTFGKDIIGSALYVVNWVLAGRSVDYLAEDVGVSPVQHFWSLAVEEQFYIVWPLLMVVLAWWLRRHGSVNKRLVLGFGIFLLIVPSFVWSIYLTNTNPERAFFVTTTRLWEMGIGAFVAIGVPLWMRFSPKISTVLGWVGLAAVVISGFIITSETPWPSYAAMLPTIGTAVVIIAGFTATKNGPSMLLSWRPAVWIGGLSYSLYLWHWPLLVAATAYWGELGAKKGILITAVAFIPAYLGHILVENPFRFAKPIENSNRLALSMGANFSLIGVVAGLGLLVASPSSTPGTPDDAMEHGALGAAALEVGPQNFDPVTELERTAWYVPSAVDAVDDVPLAYKNNCHQNQHDSEPIQCAWGASDAEKTIVVAGDSKIEQWESAMRVIAAEKNWKVISFTKSACAFSSAMQVSKGEPYTSCNAWGQNVYREILQIKPDLVLTSSRSQKALANPADANTENQDAMVDGLSDMWRALEQKGIPVAVLLDNPEPDKSVYECVAEHFDNLEECAFSLSEGIERSGAPTQLLAMEHVKAIDFIDMTDLICVDDLCPPVIGNVLIYRQTSHLTDTYVRTLAPYLEKRLDSVID